MYCSTTASVPEAVAMKLPRLARRIVKLLGIDGYVRIDFRLTEDGKLYFLEANPNPDIERTGEFAGASESAGMNYEQMIQKLLSLALRRG